MNSAFYLKEDGVFSAQLDHFRFRSTQLAIAETIERFLKAGDHLLLLEAGTGTGKTLAYLLPLLLSGKKIILSTATRALQDQIALKEIPLIAQVTGINAKVVTLKGRRNYLCPHRLIHYIEVFDTNFDRQTGQGQAMDRILDELMQIRSWSLITRDGDTGGIENIEEDSPVWRYATSTADNCLGGRCPAFSQCPVYRARDRAASADVLVVNHHLLFTDLMMKEVDQGQLLPEAEVVVLDEAHQLPDVVGQIGGERLVSQQIFGLVEDVLMEWRQLDQDDGELKRCADDVHAAFRKLNAYCSDLLSGEDRPGDTGDLDQTLVSACDASFSRLIHRLVMVSDRSPDLEKAAERAETLAELFVHLTEPDEVDKTEIKWWEVQGEHLVFRASPLDISNMVKPLTEIKNTSWILTSATLSVSDKFDYFLRESGLGKPEGCYRFDTPFSIPDMVKYYVPREIDLPDSDRHSEELARHCLPLISANKGKTFFLFTSYKAMHKAADVIYAFFGGPGQTRPVLVQGSMSKKQLLERFVSEELSVLLGTLSFWEGVDVRGAGLQLLIMDKLPFRHPSDPLVAGKMRQYELAGGNGFTDYLLPRAVTTFRQGFGRLIREETDAGLFVLGDQRLLSKAYGRRFLGALPRLEAVDSQAQAIQYLTNLSKKPG